MSAGYLVEVVVLQNGNWISRGFHQRGSGGLNDQLTISGKPHALRMTKEFALRRAEIYRSAGHKARVVDQSDNVVIDFDQSLIEQRPVIDRFNQHRPHLYRNLFILEDRATGHFHHRWAWPEQGGPERSVSASSCEDVVQRLQELPGDVQDYLAATLDKQPELVQAAPAATMHPPIYITVPVGTESLGIRPGSALR